ncbi:MAG: hypothetical protein ACD_79C00739G0006 [uncultured bacterium]|nr:MAG: hypothetical protein ACD_79C00739G0006 [uncultured bacterium]
MRTIQNFIKKFSFIFNIYFILIITLILTLFFQLSKLNTVILDFLNANFSLSMNALKSFKVWTLVSYSLFNNNLFILTITFVVILTLTNSLKKIFSEYELGKYFLKASLIGGISHVLIAPNDFVTNGSFGVMMGFILLYSKVKGSDPVITIFKKPFNWNTFAFLLIILDLLTIQRDFRPDESSFANHIGIFIYSFLCFRSKNTDYMDLKKEEFIEKYDIAQKKHFNDFYSKFINKTEKPKEEISETDVDKILDKISEKGIHSLSEEEKKILKKASKMKGSPR